MEFIGSERLGWFFIFHPLIFMASLGRFPDIVNYWPGTISFSGVSWGRKSSTSRFEQKTQSRTYMKNPDVNSEILPSKIL